MVFLLKSCEFVSGSDGCFVALHPCRDGRQIRTSKTWTFLEVAPKATSMFYITEICQWQKPIYVSYVTWFSKKTVPAPPSPRHVVEVWRKQQQRRHHWRSTSSSASRAVRSFGWKTSQTKEEKTC